MQEAKRRWGSLDILHNNVGVSLAGGDAELLEITEEAFDNICRINLRGTVFACKHALAIMREQRSGAIVNISSSAATESHPYVAYKATKAGVLALTEQLAIQNAPFGIRVNSILPGLICDADGGRYASAHLEPDRVSRCWPNAWPRCRLGRQGAPGTSRTRRFSSRRTKRISSPACLYWSMEAASSTASELVNKGNVSAHPKNLSADCAQSASWPSFHRLLTRSSTRLNPSG